MKDLVNIGAYAGGLNAELDLAVKSQLIRSTFTQSNLITNDQ